jgi:hypothetical protein
MDPIDQLKGVTHWKGPKSAVIEIKSVTMRINDPAFPETGLSRTAITALIKVIGQCRFYFFPSFLSARFESISRTPRNEGGDFHDSSLSGLIIASSFKSSDSIAVLVVSHFSQFCLNQLLSCCELKVEHSAKMD